MHFFAPERPRMGEAPMYIGPDGQQIAALPDLQVQPLASGSFDVAVMLRCEVRGFKWWHCSVADVQTLAELARNYVSDPEYTLRAWFHYDFELAKPKQTLSLEDLGL